MNPCKFFTNRTEISKHPEKMVSNLKDTLSAEIQNTKVLIYSKSYCPYCVDAKNIFKAKGVEFVSHELDNMPNGGEIQSTLASMTKQRTVPQIFIGG